MNYWQFKFKEENWEYWETMEIGDVESWKSPKTRNKKPNDIAIGDIVFLYRTDKKNDRGIHFLSKVIDVNFNNIDNNPIKLEIVEELKEHIFKPEFFGFNNVMKKIDKLDQRSTSYYKFDKKDNPQKLYRTLINYIKENNLTEDLKDILSGTTLSTEVEGLVKARLGQGAFREKLIKYWKGCSVTNYKYINILIASHIKPWKDSGDKERLDVYNGLLLLPNIDKLFDKGYISFRDTGKIIISSSIDDYSLLGVNSKMKIILDKKHKKYLKFHRENVFKSK